MGQFHAHTSASTPTVPPTHLFCICPNFVILYMCVRIHKNIKFMDDNSIIINIIFFMLFGK